MRLKLRLSSVQSTLKSSLSGENVQFANTSGPCYLRVCYPRFWLFVVSFLLPKFAVRGFSSIIRRISKILAQRLFGENNAPLLSAVLVFAGFSKNLTPAKNEGRLYPKLFSVNSFFSRLISAYHACVASIDLTIWYVKWFVITKTFIT